MSILTFTFITTKDQGVSSDTTIALTLHPIDEQGLYKDRFPVVWKPLNFTASQDQSVNVSYVGTLGIGAVVGNDVVDPESFVKIRPGQHTIIGMDTQDLINYSDPTPKTSVMGNLTAVNKTGISQNIIVGIVGLDGIQPVLFWDRVADGHSVSTPSALRLHAYSNKDYWEKQIIRTEPQASTLIGEWDLNALLDPQQTFHLLEDPSQGGALRIDWVPNKTTNTALVSYPRQTVFLRRPPAECTPTISHPDCVRCLTVFYVVQQRSLRATASYAALYFSSQCGDGLYCLVSVILGQSS